jgi:hypothetical protein
MERQSLLGVYPEPENEVLRGAYPAQMTEILRFAQDDQRGGTVGGEKKGGGKNMGWVRFA